MKRENTPKLGTDTFSIRLFQTLVSQSKLLWICIALFGIALWAVAKELATPATQAELAGAWVGFDHNRLYFCRVEFSPDGKGLLSEEYLDKPAVIYSISNARLEGANITVELVPKDQDAHPSYLKGTVSRTQMVLEQAGLNGKWKIDFALVREEDFESKNARVKERIKKYRDGGK